MRLVPPISEAAEPGSFPVTVGKLLGAGGSAQVYEGKLPDGTACAVKAVVHRLDGADKERHGRSIYERTQEEAGVLGRIQCPYLPAIYGVGVRPLPPGQDFAGPVGRTALLVAMDLVAGPSAADLRGRMPWGVAARIGQDVTRGMLALREVFPRLQHRDIKPANIQIALTSEGLYDRAVLLDLGAALTPRLRANTSPDATVAGGIIGTIGYLPPECMGAICDGTDDARDVFALGMTLYALRYGKPLYHRIPGPAEYREMWRALPEDVPQIVRMMLFFDPWVRPSWQKVASGLDLTARFHRIGRRPFALPPVTAKITGFPEPSRLLERGEVVTIAPLDLEDRPAAGSEDPTAPLVIPDPSAAPEGTRFVRLHPETQEPEQDDLPTTISNPGIAWDDDPESAMDYDDDDAPPAPPAPPEEPTAPGKLPALPPGWSPVLVVAASVATLAGFALAGALIFLGASILYSVIYLGV